MQRVGMSLALSPWLDWEAIEKKPRWQSFSVPWGHLDRAEAAAAAGDLGAAAHFFALAEIAMTEAVVVVEAVNSLPGDGMTRLLEIARRMADGEPETSHGYAIEFRCAEDEDEISMWLVLRRVGPETGAVAQYWDET